ncbi:MAG: hypothetical protein KIT82_05370 [Bradyrhizobium sp.]|nr:hypothetical protein [Bradyrhizobium sp.]
MNRPCGTIRGMRGLGFAMSIAWLAASGNALACACCTHEGQRNVGTVALDSGKREQIESLRFAARAKLFTGEADVETIGGIVAPSGVYSMTAAWQDKRLVLSFRDDKGRSGTLALTLPKSIAVFEVDPRNGSDSGQGPVLYKEWKLSVPAAATGVFAPGSGPRQTLTLIVQGHGNSCTDASDFTHWTLVMQGPKANFALFGEFVTNR